MNGMVGTGIYITNGPDAVAYVLEHSRAQLRHRGKDLLPLSRCARRLRGGENETWKSRRNSHSPDPSRHGLRCEQPVVR